MKKILILFLLLPFAVIGQTKINGARLMPGTVEQEAFSPTALAAVDQGALAPPYELVFNQPRKKHTLSVTTDITLSLASSGNVSEHYIFVYVTGNGSNTLTFPPTWRVIKGAFNPNAYQRIFFEYVDGHVLVTIEHLTDIVTATLSAAEVIGSNPGQLNLTFAAAVNITSAGWTINSDGDPVAAGAVTGSGTTTPVFTLDRDIEPGETVTISYNPTVGNTTSLSATPLAAISAFPVITPPEEPEEPPALDCDFDVDTEAEFIAAAAAAVPGDVICVRNGTYRITITPTNSGTSGNPITYVNYPGHTPIISGLNDIGTSGWTLHNGGPIYKKTITLPNASGFTQTITGNTVLAANQIFRNGEMQIQARYPNAETKEDMFDLYKCRSQAQGTNLVTGTSGGQPSTAFDDTSITDTALGSLGNLTGAKLFINGWFISGTRTVNTHSGNQITFNAYSNNSGINVNYRKWWFVTNKIQLLDIAREWHYEGGILYFLQDGGGTPTGTLEYKARNWGFNLSGKTDIVIKGIEFVGCEVRGDASTHRITLDNIRASYTNHVLMAEFGVGTDESYNAQQTGFRLIGSDNIVTNSEFDFGASQCIWLGNNGRAINNKIENYGYDGNYGAGITFWGNTSGQVVERNTMTGFGRSAIDFSMTWGGFNTNWLIRLNDLSDYCKINNDGGAVYTGRYTTTTGGEFAYNWIHDSGAKPDYENKRIEGILAAFYADQGTGPFLFHHNVFWDNWENMPAVQDRADFYILARLGSHTNTPASLLYNNTFASDWTGQAWSYITYFVTPQDIQKNNIYDNQIIVNWGGNTITGAPPGGTTTVTNSVLMNQTPNYLGTGTGGLVYRPANGSAFQVDKGVHIPGITDGFTGASPDAGAYEWNEPTPFVPGYGGPVTGGSTTFVDATAANGVVFSVNGVAGATATWTVPYAAQSGCFGGSNSYTSAVNSTAKFTFSGTNLKIYADRLATHGTATLTIDGGAPATLDFNDTPHGLNQLIYDSGTISAGSHNVVITTVTVGTQGAIFDYYTKE